MNKHSIITIIAIIVIAIPVIYGIWNAISAENLELRSPGETFRYFDMASNEKIEICNPNPFLVTINGLKINVYYRNEIKGMFEVGPTTLGPQEDKLVEINFSSESLEEVQYLFMHMDSEFTGEQVIRIDPRPMEITTTFDTRIIGFIPYQPQITQSGFDFVQMMNEDTTCKNNT